MLAYELYRLNKKSNADRGIGIPIKKIYINKNKIEIDNTPIQEYDPIKVSGLAKKFLQNTFNMPIDTNSKINLPEKLTTSPRSARPYVTIYGRIYLKGTNSKRGTNRITLGDEDEGPFAELSIPDYKYKISSGDMLIKNGINKKNYFIGSNTLYEHYVKNKILVQDRLPSALFKKIAEEFFEHLKSANTDWPKKIIGSFMLYILPNNEKITYRDDHDEQQSTQNVFIDSFGERNTEYPYRPTPSVGFMSYNEKSFPINCTSKQDFYKNFCVGKKSHQRIILPEAKALQINKFKWYFLDLDHPNRVFSECKAGIYAQLHKNYLELKSDKIKALRASYKVVCIKGTLKKQEIMIDENLTMQRLESIFSQISNKEIEMFAYESLIINRGNKSIYRYYTQAIKSLLGQTSFNQTQLLEIFTDEIRNIIRLWLKNNKSDRNVLDFFKKSEFCRKTLNRLDQKHNLMNSNEEFASRVGAMARVYVDFRTKTENYNNSFRSILSKPRYDFNTLKFVVKTIGNRINLLNTSEAEQRDILDKLSNVAPPKEFNEEESNKDFSYHFYMGYFRGV